MTFIRLYIQLQKDFNNFFLDEIVDTSICHNCELLFIYIFVCLLLINYCENLSVVSCNYDNLRRHNFIRKEVLKCFAECTTFYEDFSSRSIAHEDQFNSRCARQQSCFKVTKLCLLHNNVIQIRRLFSKLTSNRLLMCCI